MYYLTTSSVNFNYSGFITKLESVRKKRKEWKVNAYTHICGISVDPRKKKFASRWQPVTSAKRSPRIGTLPQII